MPQSTREVPRSHARTALVVDFANTLACPACRVEDALTSPSEFLRWTNTGGRWPVAAVRREDLRKLRHFRGAVLALLEAEVRRTRPPASALHVLEEVANRAGSLERLEWNGGKWRLRAVAGAGGVEGLMPLVARSITVLLTGPDRSRLRSCHGVGCVHFLFARTRSQIWCSPTGCGNRARVSRHYWRGRRDSNLPRRGTSRPSPSFGRARPEVAQ
jgi:predicted RNA-binding Zn ribbon-like protein